MSPVPSRALIRNICVIDICLLGSKIQRFYIAKCLQFYASACFFRYFMHGVCREGNQCLFSHDLANSKPSTICKYYQKGCCAYGTRCRQEPRSRPSCHTELDAIRDSGPSFGTWVLMRESLNLKVKAGGGEMRDICNSGNNKFFFK